MDSGDLVDRQPPRKRRRMEGPRNIVIPHIPQDTIRPQDTIKPQDSIKPHQDAVKSQDTAQPPSVLRDPVYFYDDADSWIIVQNTLFKIHYSLLSRDNSVFCDMFSLPTGEPLDDTFPLISEEEPLRLYDEVDDFRALCYALYTPLHELSRPRRHGTVSPADLSFLITLLKTTNKYNFQSLQDCVIDHLVQHCCRPKEGRRNSTSKWDSPLDRMPLHELERLQHLTEIVNHVELYKAVERSRGMRVGDVDTH